MKKNMKRVLAVFLATIVTATSLSGCGGDSSKVFKEAKLTKPGEFPIVEEKIELTAFTPTIAPNTDLSSEVNEFSKWYEDKTNVKIKWMTSSSEDANSKLSILMASNEVPDILLGTAFSHEQLQLFGSQKQLLPLNDLIENQGFYIKNLFKYFPNVKSEMISSDGNIYGLPQMFESQHSTVPFRMYVYKPWLAKLGIDEPKTTEDFKNMLKAFKTKDPNGNGIADEIPLSGSEKGWNTDFWIFLMNSFIYTSESSYYSYLDNGKVKLIWDQEAYKEGLKYLNELYSEGLIAEQSFTQDDKQLVAMGSNPGVNILGAAQGGYQASVTTLEEGKSGRWTEFETIAPVKGPKGVQYAAGSPTIPYFKMSIGANTKYPEVAFRTLEAMYDYEIGVSSGVGLKDKYWKMRATTADDKTVDGTPPVPQVRENLKATAGIQENVNYAWGNIAGTTGPVESMLIPKNPETNLEYYLYKSYLQYKPYISDVHVPLLTFTLDESKTLSDANTSIENYATSSRTSFIINGKIDEGWDEYVTNLKNMGIDKVNGIYQTAYDRKK